jgi:MFS family permease
MPSFLNRFHAMAPDEAGKRAALVVLAGALGSVVFGWIVERIAAGRPRARLVAVAAICLLSLAIFLAAFAGGLTGDGQFMLIVIGGFVMAGTIGPVTVVVFDVVHPGLRSTGAAVLSLLNNLLGLAIGPFIAGVMSDWWGLQTALVIIPAFSLLAAIFFLIATRSYESDMKKVAVFKLHQVPSGAPAVGPVAA